MTPGASGPGRSAASQVMVPPPVTGSAPVRDPPAEIDDGSTTTPTGTASVTRMLCAALTVAPVALVTRTV